MKIKKDGLNSYLILDDNLKNKLKIKITTSKRKYIKVSKEIQEEFIRSKKERKAQRNEYDRHIEHLQLSEVQINARAINKSKSTEEYFIENEGESFILREIWNLPEPQNRRVYMYIVDEFSLTKIAKIENRAIPVIKRSIDRGIQTLQQKLKKFLDEG